MRTHTLADEALVGNTSTGYDHYLRLKLTDSTGAVFKDVSVDLGSVDWLLDLSLKESIDSNAQSIAATLVREAFDNAGVLQSLAPMMTAAPLNNPGGSYAPMVDVGRQWLVEFAAVAKGTTPISTDWHPLGEGYTDYLDVGGSDPTMRLQGRDLAAVLQDAYIMAYPQQIYGSANGTPVENVMQAILNNNVSPAPSLYVPTPANYAVRTFVQDYSRVFDALLTQANKIGWQLRYRYDASDGLQLTFWQINRNPNNTTDVLFTLGPDQYTAIPVTTIDITAVRNYVEVVYIDFATGQRMVSATAKTSTSINRYGFRPIQLDMTGNSQINDATSAAALRDAVLSDLEYPLLQQRFEVPGLWYVQLGDYIKFLANGVQYDTDQYGGVTAINHTFKNGQLVTVIDVRAKPAGRYRSWIAQASLFNNLPLPTPQFTFWSADSPDGGLKQDARVWVGIQFEINTEYVEIFSETGPTNQVIAPDLSNITNNYIIRRQVNIDNWYTAAPIATTQGWWRSLVCFGVGYDGRKGLISKALIQAGSASVTPSNPPATVMGGFSTFNVVRDSTGVNADLTWTASACTGLPTGAVPVVLVIRDGVTIAQIDPTVGKYTDLGIDVGTAYTYQVQQFYQGMTGQASAYVLPALSNGSRPTIDPPSPQYWAAGLVGGVNFNWTCLDPALGIMAVEQSADGSPGSYREVGRTTITAGTTTGQLAYLDTSRAYYRLVAYTSGGTFLSYSDPVLWAGYSTSNPAPTSSTGTVPSIQVSSNATGHVTVAWNCTDPAASYVNVEASYDNKATWTAIDTHDILTNGSYIDPDANNPGATYYRVKSYNASNVLLATSIIAVWVFRITSGSTVVMS